MIGRECASSGFCGQVFLIAIPKRRRMVCAIVITRRNTHRLRTRHNPREFIHTHFFHSRNTSKSPQKFRRRSLPNSWDSRQFRVDRPRGASLTVKSNREPVSLIPNLLHEM